MLRNLLHPIPTINFNPQNRADPPHKKIKTLLGDPQKIKKITQKKKKKKKKPLKFKKKNTHRSHLKEFWNKEKEKSLKSSGFSFLLDWPLFLHFFSFSSAPHSYTCSGSPILLLLILSLSPFNFFVLFWCPHELLLTKFNLSEIFSILTYQATHTCLIIVLMFFSFSFFFF